MTEEAQDGIRDRGSSFTKYGGFGLLGLGVVATVGSSLSLASAHHLRDSIAGSASQTHVAEVNDRIRARDTFATIGFGVAGGASISGLLLLLWPHREPALGFNASFDGRALHLHGEF